jgi:holliday junction DNA helicase RuvA
MIARITGSLVEVNAEANTVLLEAGALAYELMVPGYAISDLSSQLNRTITLYCLEYIEGGAMGSSMTPRMIGFPQREDKTFFNRFISVKGIGVRKALRAMARPLADIAYSIENGDAKMLTTLPEIGKRTAEQIIAELKGKMADFAVGATRVAGTAKRALNEIEREAFEILLQLGEQANQAEAMIDRVRQSGQEITGTDELVQAVYRMKAKI